MNYAQSLSGLFVGSYPQAIGDVEQLRRESAITAVLNLQTDEDMCSVNLNWHFLRALAGREKPSYFQINCCNKVPLTQSILLVSLVTRGSLATDHFSKSGMPTAA
jgi:hypothetical protein